MKKPTRFSLAMLISGAALATALSAPAAFAEENHRGRGSDDVVTMAPPAADIDDNDVNDDHGVDAVVPTTAGAPTVATDDND